jgi:hypothetical protein
VPELVEDLGTKRATVKLDEQRIELANLSDGGAVEVVAESTADNDQKWPPKSIR